MMEQKHPFQQVVLEQLDHIKKNEPEHRSCTLHEKWLKMNYRPNVKCKIRKLPEDHVKI